MKLALDPYMFRDVPLLELPGAGRRARATSGSSCPPARTSSRSSTTPASTTPASTPVPRRALAAAGVGVSSVLPLYRWSGPDEDERAGRGALLEAGHPDRLADLGVDTHEHRVQRQPARGRRRASGSSGGRWRSCCRSSSARASDSCLEPHPDDWEEDGKRALDLIRGINSPHRVVPLLRPAHLPPGQRLRRHHGQGRRPARRWSTSPTPSTTPARRGLRYIVNPPGSQVTVHQHLDIGQGEVDFDEFFAGLERIGFDGIVTSCVFAWEERARESSHLHARDHRGLPLPLADSANSSRPDQPRPPHPTHVTPTRDHAHDERRSTHEHPHPHHPPHRRPGLDRHRRAHQRRSTTRPRASRPACLDLASADLVGEVVAGAKQAWERAGPTCPWPSAARSSSSSASCSTGTRSEIAALDHRRARQGALRRARRGHPRPRGRRVRLRHPAPAQGRVTPRTPPPTSTSTRIRQSLGVVAVISPFNFPAMVPLWFVPVADRHAATPWCSSRRRRTPRRPSRSRGCGREAGLPDGVMNVVNGDKEAVDALLDAPRRQVGVLRRLHPDRALRLRDRAPPTASASRPSAGRRTTCWCCPTPTSTSPPTPPSTPGSARRASAAWRSRRSSRSSSIADELVSKIADRMGKLRTGDGTRGCDMGPLVTRRGTATGSRATSRPGVDEGADRRRRRPRRRLRRRRATASSSRRP